MYTSALLKPQNASQVAALVQPARRARLVYGLDRTEFMLAIC